MKKGAVGFGVQMNPYLYCAPNWGEVNERNVGDFERKVIDLAPQHVRVFFMQHWFDGRADDISMGDPRMAESFIRTCRLAQRAGASINVTHWRGPWPEPEKQMAAFAATLESLVAPLSKLDIDAEVRIGEAHIAGARMRDAVLRVVPGAEASP